MGWEATGAGIRCSAARAGKDGGCSARHTGRLGMVASNPMDVAPKGRPLLDEQSPTSASDSSATVVSPGRPRLPAERNVNAFMNDFNAGVVDFLKGLMVQYYGERTYARFYALETIARVPYFGYLCVLHLYETLGKWRQAEYLKVHFAESYNELHHLLIMEELGGNVLFRDRWFAQHAAFFYFFVVVGLYLSNPRNAYNLNQHVEEHAFSTYDSFLSDNQEALKQQPAPEASLGCLVRNDEWEHVKTMKAMQLDVPPQRA
ncbi:conserved unknown protein [Ectocarpus siliculosus]|uniref:Ubiquinol oxidase n=1 Tax=Ectocarpus siliculosus TaxID=2880 RepID=D7FS91_ECTSI|nr:conserved unknown protein [Ectocarpus siliculosus]|eukprot:CBJ31032.1 conserved unknown protein [Ectocarpus siliculosus]